MNSRETILQRIREGLRNAHTAGFEGLTAPPVHQVWPRCNPPAAALAAQFTEELKLVHGETIRAADVTEARQKLAELVTASDWATLAAMDRPLVREVAQGLPAEKLAWAPDDWPPKELAMQPVSVITAEWLLADTGTCVVSCGTATERLLCYLPPACVVVARVDQIVEHMPAAWPQIAARVADPAARGEFVMVTGPSRTADIEKILILGAHGPKRLVVLLIG
jgi:L-lactate dehydrogenase complex protein LldG